jgi:hypothetical protein
LDATAYRPAPVAGRARSCLRAFPLVLLACAFAARAQHKATDPGAPWPQNVDLARATAMGGANGAIATGNEALTTNPAGLAQTRRYHLEIDGVTDPRFPAQGLMISLVDSVSAPVATGLLFSRWGSGQPGGRGEGWYAGLAYSYGAGSTFIGGMTKYYRFATPLGEAHRFAQDFAILAKRGTFGYALVFQNIATSSIPGFPITGAVAIAWGTDTDWHLAFDYKADLSDTHNIKSKGAGGLEYLIEQVIALRGGATYDVSRELWWVSAGLGFLTEKGGAQLVWRRRVAGAPGFDQLFEAAITLYLE